MSDEERVVRAGQEQLVPPTSVRGRGVRIAELGRPPVEINLNPGEVLTVRELIERGVIAGQGVQVYVNMRPVESLDQTLQNGDAVVAVRKIVGG